MKLKIFRNPFLIEKIKSGSDAYLEILSRILESLVLERSFVSGVGLVPSTVPQREVN